ncbi:efflux transporter outer membrane subunit, partial [Glaciimonas sp. GG7]
MSLVVVLSGCTIGPDFQPPIAPEVQQYTSGTQPVVTSASNGAGGGAQHFEIGADIPSQWWSVFHSPELEVLVRSALTNSPTLTQAKATLRAARENLNAQTGTDLPQVNAQLGSSRQQIDTTALGVPNIPQSGPFTLYNAALNVSYTIDAFGLNRRTLEGLQAQVENQEYQLQAARLTLASNVVTTAIRQAALTAQIAETEQLLRLQRAQIIIMQQRLSAGGIARLDLVNQRTLLAQSEATLPTLRQQLAQINHQLAVYLGKAPAQIFLQPLELNTLTLPEALPLTLPSSLARQRPDIRAAQATLHQASAQVGVATANLYPQLTLSGSAGSERTGINQLANSINVWSIGIKFMQPLFDGGQLRAKQRSAAAAYDAALATWQQTVLQALQQVADVLRALESDAITLQAIDSCSMNRALREAIT